MSQNHCQPWYVTDDTLHQDVNVPYVRDEIKKFSQRYADRLEEQPQLAIDLMSDTETPHRLKRKLPSICHWAYTLQDFYKLPNVLLNITLMTG